MLLNDSEKLSQEIQNLKTQSEQKKVAEQLDILLVPEVRFYWDFRFAASNYFYIVNKRKQKVKFIFNALQEVLYASLLNEFPIRDLIIKARKFGISTFFLLLYYWDCITSPNTSSVIIAEEYSQTKRMFRIVSHVHNNLDSQFQPKTSIDNTREMMFADLNSTFFIGSAQKKNFGRADTVANLHCSEFAFWPDPEGLLGSALSEAVPQTGNVVIETTPNRLPYLRELIDNSKRTGKPFHYKFFPWFVFPEYRIPITNEKEVKQIQSELTAEEKLAMKSHNLDLEQMNFWLDKRKKLKRKTWQEYPFDDTSCFLGTDENSFFDTRRLQELYLICQRIEPIGKLQNDEILIYNDPIPGERYLIAADTSGGGINSTYSTATVIRYSNAEEVAELRARITPVQLARSLAYLGSLYNTASVIVERNNHGHSVLNTLENQLFYPNVYYHVDLDKAEWLRKISKVGKIDGTDPFNQGDAGWPTNTKTKPVMFDDLREEVIDEQQMIVKSQIFIEECFNVKSKGDKIYSDGYMDTVIARAIVWQVRKRSVPASLNIKVNKSDEGHTTKRIINPWDKSSEGVDYQTLDREPIGMRSKSKVRRRSDNKKTVSAPWSL